MIRMMHSCKAGKSFPVANITSKTELDGGIETYAQVTVAVHCMTCGEELDEDDEA